jgi:D-aminopeptidase
MFLVWFRFKTFAYSSGVRVGQVTVGKDGDDVCNGVTVILPRDPLEIHIPCYAGTHTLNGNGEVTGSYQIKDWGYTNTVCPLHTPRYMY